MTNGTLITLIGILLGKYPQTGNTDAIRQALKCNLNPVHFYSLVSFINSYNPHSMFTQRTEWLIIILMMNNNLYYLYYRCSENRSRSVDKYVGQ